MKLESTDNIRKELLAAGAKNSEVRELEGIAARLRQLRITATAKPKRSRKIILLFSLAACAAVMLLVVIATQNALPGSLLYPIQKSSDNIAIAIHPSYRATVMMRRAKQVEILVEKRAPSNVILATLADYRHQAEIYKASYTNNYEVFEHCKASLQQAVNQAVNPERQVISNALISLQTV